MRPPPTLRNARLLLLGWARFVFNLPLWKFISAFRNAITNSPSTLRCWPNEKPRSSARQSVIRPPEIADGRRARGAAPPYGRRRTLQICAISCKANPKLNLALFWADIEEQRANARTEERRPIRYWQVHFGMGRIFWELTARDLPALYSDLSSRPLEDDKRIALSAIAAVLGKEGRLKSEAENLRALVSGSASSSGGLGRSFGPAAA